MEVLMVHRCSSCDLILPAADFNKDSSSKYGVKSCCRLCQRRIARARHAAWVAAGKKRVRRKTPKREPLWPLPTYTIQDSLACVQLRKWRGPVSNEPMRARL